jgi:nicotinamide-nucleotide amidase
MFDERTTQLAVVLGDRLLARGWLLATAESCTGGGIACAVTEIAGSSAWFDRGFVTYSNAAKVELLGVPPAILETRGAVSEETALAMAAGALARSTARLAVAVTGIAGPAGGSPAKPVGTVCFGYAGLGLVAFARRRHFDGDRAAVRARTVHAALVDLVDLLENQPRA